MGLWFSSYGTFSSASFFSIWNLGRWFFNGYSFIRSPFGFGLLYDFLCFFFCWFWEIHQILFLQKVIPLNDFFDIACIYPVFIIIRKDFKKVFWRTSFVSSWLFKIDRICQYSFSWYKRIRILNPSSTSFPCWMFLIIASSLTIPCNAISKFIKNYFQQVKKHHLFKKTFSNNFQFLLFLNDFWLLDFILC